MSISVRSDVNSSRNPPPTSQPNQTGNPEALPCDPTLETALEPNLEPTLEQSIRAGREFSLAEVIGREAGDFLKGVSPIPPLEQTKNIIQGFIEQHLSDPEGVLQMVLKEWIDDEVHLDRYRDNPLGALGERLEELLTHPNLLWDLVRQVDMRWGQMNQERPHFQRPGQKPDPDDPYTHESVHQLLRELNQRIPLPDR